MRKNRLFTIFFVLLLGLMPFSPVVLAGSEENIDSFDVHPSNRWIETEVGYDATVSDGLLNMSDVGDGSGNVYSIDRSLRDLDGTIEIRFKPWDGNTTYNSNHGFYIYLWGGTTFAATNSIYLYGKGGVNNGYSLTYLQYYDIEGDIESIEITGNDRLFGGIWYNFRIDYDILKSDCRLRLYYDNGSKIWDYDWYDLGTDRVNLFSSNVLNFRVTSTSFLDTQVCINYIDYVKAPFKEREWEKIDDPTDPQWLQEGWNFIEVEDDIDDAMSWELVLPYLDSFSGVMSDEMDIYSNFAAGTSDNMVVYVYLYAVDADDGDLHEVVQITMQHSNLGSYEGRVIIELDNSQIFIVNDAIGTDFRVDFNIALEADRSRVIVRSRIWVDRDSAAYVDAGGEVLVSDCAVDPSQEFVVRIISSANFDGNVNYKWMMEGVDVLTKDIWSDIGGFIDGMIGVGQEAAQGGVDLIQGIFVWLGNLIVSAFDVVIEGLQTALETALGSIETAIGTMQSALDTAIGSVQTAVEAVTTAIGELAAQVATAIWNGVGAAVGTVITALQGLASDVADFIFDTLDFLLDLLLDLADEFWAILQAIVFSIWEALSLPDLLGMFDELLFGLGLVADGFGQFVTDMNTLIDNIFTLSVAGGLFIFFFLPITISPTIGGWIEKVLQFLAFDITFGVSVFGFGARVPAGAVWIAIIIGSGVVSGSILGGFL